MQCTSDRVVAAVSHCSSTPYILLLGSLKLYLGSCRCQNNKVIMAVHECMWRQEPNFYRARILELMPRCGIWSVYHTSIVLGIVLLSDVCFMCVCVILCKLALLLKCHVLYVIHTMQRELLFSIMLCFGHCPLCIDLKYKKLVTLQRPNTEWH
jgi:hypothetical protein